MFIEPMAASSPMESLASEVFVAIAAYLPERDLFSLSISCRALRTVFDTRARASAFVARHGPTGAGIRLFWLMSPPRMLTRLIDDGDWPRQAQNRDLAFAVLAFPAVRRELAHNLLVDIIMSGVREDALCSARRERVPEWFGMLDDRVPGRTSLVCTHDLLLLYSTGDPDLFEKASVACRSGARLSMAFLERYPLTGTEVRCQVRLWEDPLEDDERLSLDDVLSLVAPPSLRCFDVGNASHHQLSSLLGFFKEEIAQCAVVRWTVRHAVLKSGLASVPVSGLQLNDGDWLSVAKAYIDDGTKLQKFDWAPFIDLLGHRRVDLRKLVPGRLDTELRPSMHPSVARVLCEELRFRDAGPDLFEGLEGLAESLRGEIGHILHSDWREPVDPEDMRRWRAFFLLGEISHILHQMAGGPPHYRQWRGMENEVHVAMEAVNAAIGIWPR
ncbi:hypothetical protein DFJ74DRAFT_386946 [Hyaloraphidium curvatum]|nr:hypothetical protein DFJ74DRAFT_386946 [Hyaloraphidium curvatum]